MKVVIDTNVLVSAVLKDRDPETVIMFVANRDDFEWIVSKEIMAEYSEVLGRPKFGLPKNILHEWCAMLDYFITGDSDFNEAHQLLTTTILSVSQFKKLVSDQLACNPN